jgi:hypothetical protein
MVPKVSACVRMYRLHELGDCFLVTFRAGKSCSRLLVDCGSFRNSQASRGRLTEIVEHIRGDLGGQPIDVVVGTHQHNDHVSGFSHCAELFKSIGVSNVWLSWLDDPRDTMARSIGEKHNNFGRALYDARRGLETVQFGARGQRSLEIVDDMLGFYGATPKEPPVFPANCVAMLKTLSKEQTQYLRPGNVLDLPGMPVGSVRVHVLGPPRDSELLYRKDPRTGESYDHALALANLSAQRMLSATTNLGDRQSADEVQYPFNAPFKRRDRDAYSDRLSAILQVYEDEPWRDIEDDWLQEIEGLSLYLDSFTNNSSLVFAIELVASGKVLLFAADAQSGNWLSWDKIQWDVGARKTDDLLAKTVLYKVGHHGSHNASLVAALEKMTHPDLIAMIPVHKQDPNIVKDRGWRMPATKLLQRLMTKTSGRVMQMDNDPPFDPKSWVAVDVAPVVEDLYMEVTIA